MILAEKMEQVFMELFLLRDGKFPEPIMSTIEKFQNLLKKLFQFESSDLDFGIYRILNYKRDKVEKFINEDLKEKIETAFAKHKDERLTNINQNLKKLKERVIQALGEDAFSSTGELKEEFWNRPIGREYLSVKAQKEEAETIDEIKLQVFNDLYNFFSRYYEEGDFIPHYRYSIKGHKYAIPYNGEEIKLYWANSEQYYTKTGLLFRDYIFKANNYKVIFRIVSAKEELASNKATKQRFFILDNIIEDKNLIICFQYRELTEVEEKDYGIESGNNTVKQEKINQKTYEETLKKVKDVILKGVLGKEYNIENKTPFLLYQLNRFTAKNTRDYFIHKNLKKFLSDQLDYFIKAEVLDIETLEKERFLDKHLTRAKVVREIGQNVIDFLSQIENFQKKLWEKKKFVLKTEYVITTDRLPEEFYDKIWDNTEQKKEWDDLGFEIPKEKGDLRQSKLPIDTKYFSQQFKEKLLEKLTENDNLDDLLDGLLIKSENWQALNLLQEKYKQKVQTIYIDPPYNTGSDGFLYRDKYQHSSWLSMIENRLGVARELLRENGVFFVSIDDNEVNNLRIITSASFKEIEIIKVKMREPSRQLAQKSLFQKSIEYCLSLSKGTKPSIQLRRIEYEFKEYRYKIIEKTKPNRVFNIGKYKIEEFLPGQYEILEISDIKDPWIAKAISIRGKIKTAQFTGKFYEENLRPFFEKEKNYDVLYKVYGIGDDGFGFRYIKNPSQKTINAVYYQGVPINVRKSLDNPIKEISYYDYYDFEKEMNNESKFIRDMGLIPIISIKPVEFIEFLLSMVKTNKENIILDFFAGSGTTAHAVMKLNKKDGNRRKFILVEMADYFDTVIIPRIKKIAYSFNWEDGHPQDTNEPGVFFKYHILEQYEDTLDNIALIENQKIEDLFKDEYLLKYFLDYETKESPCLLNIENLKKPFDYKLKVNLQEVGEPREQIIDIPETFNYFLGIKINKIKTRENNNRKYMFIGGEKEGKHVAIVWREYDDFWSNDDFKKDKEFIIQELDPWAPQILYINGQSVLTPQLGRHTVEIRYIEPEFKKMIE
ncbi:site-specific DNA-methyltransferase [Methylacidiphilum caldifontis]|nr:site-specific DNA-methyltransferase [Methylacidiphilum caldifontis]